MAIEHPQFVDDFPIETSISGDFPWPSLMTPEGPGDEPRRLPAAPASASQLQVWWPTCDGPDSEIGRGRPLRRLQSP